MLVSLQLGYLVATPPHAHGHLGGFLGGWVAGWCVCWTHLVHSACNRCDQVGDVHVLLGVVVTHCQFDFVTSRLAAACCALNVAGLGAYRCKRHVSHAYHHSMAS